jgi:hypothetical protein
MIFYFAQILITALYDIFVRRKIFICGSFKPVKKFGPQIPKRLDQQIAKPQSVTFAESPQSSKLFKSTNLRTCDFRNLLADRLPLNFSHCFDGQYA